MSAAKLGNSSKLPQRKSRRKLDREKGERERREERVRERDSTLVDKPAQLPKCD